MFRVFFYLIWLSHGHILIHKLSCLFVRLIYKRCQIHQRNYFFGYVFVSPLVNRKYDNRYAANDIGAAC